MTAIITDDMGKLDVDCHNDEDMRLENAPATHNLKGATDDNERRVG